MSPKRRSAVLTSSVVLAAGVGSAAPVSPPPEYGLRGLRRVEIVFVNVGRGGMAGGIGPALRGAGLEVVEHCRRDDLACAKLYLTAETASISGVADRALLVGIELSQPVQLKRDQTVVLSAPTTWSEHQVGFVAAQHSATSTACLSLSGLAASFGSMWSAANK